jgi:isopenicillin-N epimerase
MTPPEARFWTLDPTVDFLNHGSFGACPRPVLEAQRAWQDRLEAEPVLFLDRELPELLAAARAELGAFLGADPEGLAFVPNATTGVNAVLRSLRFEPGDELLATDHEYNATLNALREVADRAGARVVVAAIPYPIASPAQVTDAVLDAVTPRTRLALISHVTSPTAAIFPIHDLVPELDRRGADTLLDAAHSPGMVALDLGALGAAYVTGNAHKWLCAPKGSAFLHVREDRRAAIRPLVISHGANRRGPGVSRFRAEFDWPGTTDPCAALSIPAALRFMGGLLPGGWAELMAANRRLALAGRDLLCAALGTEPPVPDEMLGAMAGVPLPDDLPRDVQARLFDEHRIEVPVSSWPVEAALEPGAAPRARILRISAQAYNDISQYDRLAAVLAGLRAGRAQASATRSDSAE